MISVTSIEEIVKYQKELLNHQRNQKQIQQETIKLLSSLNKNITFMLDRLDDFASKTNIKLDVPNAATVADSYINFATNSNNHHHHHNLNDTSHLIVNSDPQSQTVTNSTISTPQQLVIFQHDTLASHTNTISSIVKTKLNKLKKSNNSNSQRSISISKLLDTTNTTVSRNATSDESIDEDASFEETTDDEEKETIQMKKKPRTTILELTNNMHQTTKAATAKETEESNNQQRFFNKYVRESVEKKLGKDFLLLHEIQEISPEVMEEIKREALLAYPPVNIRPRRAWHLAKASLRCRRRSLRRQKEKQILSTSHLDNANGITANITTTSTAVDLNSSSIDETINETTKTIIKITPI